MKVPRDAARKAFKCVRCGATLAAPPDQVPPAPRPNPGEQPSAAAPQPEEPFGAAKAATDKLIGQLLLEHGLITEAQREQALGIQVRTGQRICEILLELQYLSKTDFHAFLSKQSGVPSINLRNIEEIPKDVIALVPESFARDNVILPIDRLGSLLTVGMACPLDRAALTELTRLTGLKVKAMLCPWDDIHFAIRRYYGAEEEDRAVQSRLAELVGVGPREKTGVTPEGIRSRLENLDALPMLSGTRERLQDRLEAPGCRVALVAEIAATDPPLAARLLSVANFPAYGMSDSVSSIGLALVLVGLEGLRSAFRALEPAQEGPRSAATRDSLFRVRSVFCARAAASLAQASGQSDPSAAYAAGLLHAIGQLALAAVIPAECERLARDRPAIAERIKAEEDTLGIAYPEAGYLVARHWRIAPELARAVRYHRTPERAEADPAAGEALTLTNLVALAAILTDAFEQDGTGAVFPRKKAVDLMSRLRLKEQAIQAILEQTAGAVANLAQVGP